MASGCIPNVQYMEIHTGYMIEIVLQVIGRHDHDLTLLGRFVNIKGSTPIKIRQFMIIHVFGEPATGRGQDICMCGAYDRQDAHDATGSQ